MYVQFPPGSTPGALAFVFVQRLCDRLERDNQLPAGEAERIWADIFNDLKNDGRNLAISCREAMIELKLAKK